MKQWKLTWDGHDWTEADLLGAHLTYIAKALGEDTWNVDPTKGPAKMMAVLAAFIVVSTGEPLMDVLIKLSSSPAADLVDALNIVEK